MSKAGDDPARPMRSQGGMRAGDVHLPAVAYATLTGEPGRELPEFTSPPANPLFLVRRWVRDAARAGVREPLALALCTVSSAGKPASRTVAIKDIDDDGLTFSSQGSSAKVRDIRQNPFVSGTLYWSETMQQMNFAGRALALPPAASDTLFRQRSRAAQALAIVSHSGAPLSDDTNLQQLVASLLRSEEPLVRPHDWGGYKIECDRIEFWQGSPTRIHQRLVYERCGTVWANSRLQP